MKEAATEGWTTRALERQINSLYYERLLASSDRSAAEREASGAIAPLQTPRGFVRDPVMLEFLGLPGVGRLLEADLERALLDNLQSSSWNSAAASHSSEDNIASAQSQKTSTSISSSTTTC
jgi:predicted nuclease of restriction endonuclease-like (RecB) superfamily